MNIIDAVVVLAISAALLRGFRHGLVRRTLAIIGFLAGLLAGSTLSGLWPGALDSSPLGLTYAFGLVLTLAVVLSFIGEIAGLHLTTSKVSGRKRLKPLNHALGGAFETVLILAVVWLLSGWLVNVGDFGIGDSFRGSMTAKTLSGSLPSSQVFLSRMGGLLLPGELELLSSSQTSGNTPSDVDRQVLESAQESVVKIRGYGCDKVLLGSGFVVDEGLVITNAHVIAGIEKLEVVKGPQTFRATPVWFDPEADLAVIKVPDLHRPALELASDKPGRREASMILGFPGGGDLSTARAVMIDHFKMKTYDIYGSRVINKEVFVVRGLVKNGDSGGPLIGRDGKVIGVIYAGAINDDHTGYVITAEAAKQALAKVSTEGTRVSTGRCVTH